MQSACDAQRGAELACPPSASHWVVCLGGLLGFAGSVALLRLEQATLAPALKDIAHQALIVMAATAAGIFLPDLLWQKIHRRSLVAPQPGNLGRSLVKLAGLFASLGFVAAAYWLFPEYSRPGAFYDHYWELLRLVLPPWLLLAPFYIYWIDRRMAQPEDGLWQMGCLVTLRWQAVSRAVVIQHLGGWVVKGFFLPLMFTYLCDNLARMLGYSLGTLSSFTLWYDFLYFGFYFIDVGLVSMTYLVSLRLADNHLRSTEPTGLGWAVALICYQPFWSIIGRQYLDYEPGRLWGSWFSSSPVLYAAWGTAILVLVAIYVWATIAFGGRFSNLTHRGIITGGPYRYSKHPAYLSKNLSWWLISMPFMWISTPAEALRHSLLLLLLNGVYYLRAKTEERHLARDPVYRQYAAWIERHGLLSWVRWSSDAR